jgi:hypothetical protein
MKTTKKWSKMLLAGMALLTFAVLIIGCETAGGDSSSDSSAAETSITYTGSSGGKDVEINLTAAEPLVAAISAIDNIDIPATSQRSVASGVVYNYVIFVDGVLVSSGVATLVGTTLTFTSSSNITFSATTTQNGLSTLTIRLDSGAEIVVAAITEESIDGSLGDRFEINNKPIYNARTGGKITDGIETGDIFLDEGPFESLPTVEVNSADKTFSVRIRKADDEKLKKKESLDTDTTSLIFEGISLSEVTPADAKFGRLSFRIHSDDYSSDFFIVGKTFKSSSGDKIGVDWHGYVYADKDVSVKGSIVKYVDTYSGKYSVDLSLKKGWNSCRIRQFIMEEPYSITITTQKMPNDVKWRAEPNHH